MSSEEKVKQSSLNLLLQKEVNSYLCVALPLCVILNHYNLKPWYYENFINIECIKDDVWEQHGFYYTAFEKNIATGFSRILYTRQLGYQDIGEDIIEFIKRNIIQKHYIYLFLDEYYLYDRQYYHKEHFVHDNLCFGFDETKQVLKMLSFTKNVSFNLSDISYDEVASAFYKVREIQQEYIGNSDACITISWAKTVVGIYPFELKIFYKKLMNYIYCRQQKSSKFNFGIELFNEAQVEKLSYFCGLDCTKSI